MGELCNSIYQGKWDIAHASVNTAWYVMYEGEIVNIPYDGVSYR